MLTKARGATSRANLKRGGKSGGRRAADDPVRRLSRRLIMNPKYQQTLKDKLEDGTLHPSMQALLWYYSYGKPKEEIITTIPVPVRIVHQYATDEDDAANKA